MPYFAREEARFRYHDEGTGRPLLFLHGLGASLVQPVSILEGLTDVRLLSFDFRGHGLTEFDGPPSDYQIPVFAEDAMALLDHLQINRAVVGGISLGAAVALNAAIRFPERVEGLLLIRPAWLNHPFPVNLDLLVRIGRWVERFGIEGAREHLLRDTNFQEINSRNPGAGDALLGQLRRPQVALHYEALMRLPASVPFLHWEEVQALKQPALVITNNRDPLHPRDYGRQLAIGLQGGMLKTVAPRYQDPERHFRQVCQLISVFLREL